MNDFSSLFCASHRDRPAVVRIEFCFLYDNHLWQEDRCQECLDKLNAIPLGKLKHHTWSVADPIQ